MYHGQKRTRQRCEQEVVIQTRLYIHYSFVNNGRRPSSNKPFWTYRSCTTPSFLSSSLSTRLSSRSANADVVTVVELLSPLAATGSFGFYIIKNKMIHSLEIWTANIDFRIVQCKSSNIQHRFIYNTTNERSYRSHLRWCEKASDRHCYSGLSNMEVAWKAIVGEGKSRGWGLQFL